MKHVELVEVEVNFLEIDRDCNIRRLKGRQVERVKLVEAEEVSFLGIDKNSNIQALKTRGQEVAEDGRGTIVEVSRERNTNDVFGGVHIRGS